MNETLNNQIQLNIFPNLKSVYDVINTNQELVLCPIGDEGNIALELFKYTGIIHRFCCIAVPKLRNDNARMFFHGIPVIQLNYLPHLRNTAVFIVAVPKKISSDVYIQLVQLGCKNVILIADEVYKEIRENLRQLSVSGQITNWFLRYFYDNITETKYRIAEQNEVCAVNSRTFEPYRNKFRGKKIVILATGATSNYYRPIPDAIHIGLNFAWKKEDVTLNYLFTNDGAIKKQREEMEQGFGKITNGIFISKFMDRISHCYNNYPEDVSLRFNNVNRFYIDDTVDNPIYQDICYHPLMCCASVVFAALHFSLFTYPKEIYLVGCDAAPTGHFYEKNYTLPYLDTIKVVYARMKMFANHHYPETEIISVNPIGLRGLFKDLDEMPKKD